MSLTNILENKIYLYGLLWLAFGKYFTITIFTLLAKTPLFRQKRIYRLPITKRQLKKEIASLWLILTDACVLLALMLSGAIHFAPDTIMNISITLIVFFVWVEWWMYWTHRWMHEKKWLRKYHQHHHLSVIPHPLSSISFSFGEKFFFYTCGWLLFLAVASWIIPISFIAIIGFYSFYFITSPIAHMNVELFSPPKNKIVHSILILGTSTGHALHHTRTKGNYGFITKFYDIVYNTYFKDTEAIQEKAFRKKGFNSIKVKTN